MSLTAPLPSGLRKRLDAAGLWKFPCLQCGDASATEAHHAVNYQGKRVQHPLAILPLCRNCHRGKSGALTDAEFCRFAVSLILKLYWKHCDDGWAAEYYAMPEQWERPPEQRARIDVWVERLKASGEPPRMTTPANFTEMA